VGMINSFLVAVEEVLFRGQVLEGAHPVEEGVVGRFGPRALPPS
jgi:hypothetical protein